MRYILFYTLLFIFSVNLSAQSGYKPIYLEYHSIPSDTSYTTFISYKVPYKNLVFVKENSHYSSGLTLNIEVADSNTTVYRGSTFSEMIVDDYESTNSSSDYLEGLIEFGLPKGKFNIQPFVDLRNSKRGKILKPFPVDFEKDSSGTALLPIFVEDSLYNCLGNYYYRLTNFQNNIPYSPNDFDLLIPVADTAIHVLRVEISQSDKVVYSEKSAPEFMSPITFKICKEAVVFSKSEHGKVFNVFHFQSVSKMLSEGEAKISLFNGSKKFADFDVLVDWVDKPKILYNPELAIEIVKYVDGFSAVRSLKSNSEDDLYIELYKFWEKYDPDKATGFNELMNEFYKRADYANVKFGSANQINGVLTDRGRIYIKYGPPTKIDRVYSEKNSIIESWLYERIDMGFFFKDESGLGEFKLIQ